MSLIIENGNKTYKHNESCRRKGNIPEGAIRGWVEQVIIYCLFSINQPLAILFTVNVTMYPVNFALNGVNCNVYTEHCILDTVQCTLNSVQCTLYNKQSYLLTVHFIMHPARPKIGHRQRRWMAEAGLGAFYFTDLV